MVFIHAPSNSYNRKIKSGHKGPAIIKWRTWEMVRRQSFMTICREIAHVVETKKDYTRVNFLGMQGEGKTHFAFIIAHVIHTLCKANFIVKHLGEEELINLKEIIQNLAPTNHIIIFDDVSDMNAFNSGKVIQQIQHADKRIRHLNEGDFKIVCMFIHHYVKDLPPYMRSSQYHIITSIDPARTDMLKDILPVVTGVEMGRFVKAYTKSLTSKLGKFVGLKFKEKDIKTGKKKAFFYTRDKPFRPFLFGNLAGCRMFVAPSFDTYMANEICDICGHPEKHKHKQKIDVTTINDFGMKRYGPRKWKAALLDYAISRGIGQAPKRVRHATKFLRQFGMTEDDLKKIIVYQDIEPLAPDNYSPPKLTDDTTEETDD